MIPAEDIQWKLAVCESCRQRRMMPDANNVCLECERESRGAVPSAEDIRWIISYRNPESFVRAAWRLATPFKNAATGIDARTGMVTVHRWSAGEDMPKDDLDDVLILVLCPAARKAELPGLVMAGAEGCLSPEDAEELACEAVVRSSLGDGGQRFWQAVDEQLRERSKLHRSDAKKGD